MRYFEFVAVLCLAGATSVARADDRRGRYAPPFTPYWAAPMLEAYPQGGPPGTRVEIRGATFHKDVAVFLGDQPMPIVGVGKNFVVAVVPRFARGDDFIYVVDNTGRARTIAPFDVIGRRGYPERRSRDPDYRDPHYGEPGYRL